MLIHIMNSSGSGTLKSGNRKSDKTNFTYFLQYINYVYQKHSSGRQQRRTEFFEIHKHCFCVKVNSDSIMISFQIFVKH